MPEVSAPRWRGLKSRINRELIAAIQRKDPSSTATLDIDATLVETRKRQALFCYKGSRAYQPLNVYWAEAELLIHIEFRDGNVPANHGFSGSSGGPSTTCPGA